LTELPLDAPALRFPEFSEPWPDRKGGDFFTQRRARGRAGLPIYSVTIDRGMVRRDSLVREIGANAEDEANLAAKRDDIVYNMMRMWQGAMGRAPEDCMVSPAYVVLAPKPGTSPQFFEQWFRRARSVYWLWAYSYGLTNDRLRLYFRDFEKVPMRVPGRPEQEKIAAFLGRVDERIGLLARERDLLLASKKGMAQALFSQALRFRADDGKAYPDWIEVKLGGVATFKKGRGIARDDVVAGGALPCIRYGELYTAYGERISEVQSSTDVPARELLLSQAGDVILPASGEMPLDMASAACVLQAGVALGGDLNVVRTSLDGPFLAYLLRNAKRREIGRLAQGNSIVHLSGAHLATLKLSVPADKGEQRKIAGALGAIDDKIAAVTARTEYLQAFKTGLLQQMFV
jgi:type I restriction enzyme S subunit